MSTRPTPAEEAAFEIQRLLQALEALANPACCRGASTSRFQVIGRDGKTTDKEVCLCNACGRELPLP
jgi:hypothetical protein